jgi:antitoxin ParD1/3/4
MATRNVVLTEHQEELIASLVAGGRYQNASEVLREGLRLLERDHQVFDAKLIALREAAQAGWDDVEAGRYVEVTNETGHRALWDEIDREVEARRSARQTQAG